MSVRMDPVNSKRCTNVWSCPKTVPCLMKPCRRSWTVDISGSATRLVAKTSWGPRLVPTLPIGKSGPAQKFYQSGPAWCLKTVAFIAHFITLSASCVAQFRLLCRSAPPILPFIFSCFLSLVFDYPTFVPR